MEARMRLTVLGSAVLLLTAAGVSSRPPRTLAAPAAPNPNCTITIPANPLTPAGLATPYLLSASDPGAGPCNEANSAQSAFVQAVIFDPATATFSVYEPLVIDQGTQPAVAPVVPSVPHDAVVGLWFGFNGATLNQGKHLKQADTNGGATIAAAHCVNGSGNSDFGQFSYCNARAFFDAANGAIARGALQVPALGTALDGNPCFTVRDFSVVDQDQSDNVQTTYLITPDGRLAQNTAANMAAYPTATVLGNPSDNALVSTIMDPALGCTPWTAPDLANPGHQAPALPLDELQAAADQATPVALVPLGDPMVLRNGKSDPGKTTAYRVGVDQGSVDGQHDGDTARYCREMLRIAPARLMSDASFFAGASPSPAASTLYNFLLMRFSQSYAILNCANLLNLPDPTLLQTDGNGVVIGSSFDQTILQQDVTAIAALQAQDFAADAPVQRGSHGGGVGKGNGH